LPSEASVNVADEARKAFGEPTAHRERGKKTASVDLANIEGHLLVEAIADQLSDAVHVTQHRRQEPEPVPLVGNDVVTDDQSRAAVLDLLHEMPKEQ
jgi:hypothetical protein